MPLKDISHIGYQINQIQKTLKDFVMSKIRFMRKEHKGRTDNLAQRILTKIKQSLTSPIRMYYIAFANTYQYNLILLLRKNYYYTHTYKKGVVILGSCKSCFSNHIKWCGHTWLVHAIYIFYINISRKLYPLSIKKIISIWIIEEMGPK